MRSHGNEQKLLTDQRNGRWQMLKRILVHDESGEPWWEIEIVPNIGLDRIIIEEQR